MSHPVIIYDYDFSPYAQKIKLLLTATSIPHSKVDVPAMLPRPPLESLGITFRRIPVLAIGKDMYADSSLIIDAILTKLGAGSKIKQTIADKAFEAWSGTVFGDSLALAPAKLLSDDFVKDREAIFPILARKDFVSLRPSALAEFAARLREVEEGFLQGGQGPFLNGDVLSLADVHVIFGLRWVLNDLGAKEEKGLGKGDFPRVWRFIEALPEAKPPVLEAGDAERIIREAPFAESQVSVEEDYLGFKEGTAVNIESTDAVPGAYPQKGKLLGVNKKEVVIEINHGIRLHFPRVGYIVREA